MGSLPHPWRDAVAVNDHAHHKKKCVLCWGETTLGVTCTLFPLVLSMWLLWWERLHPLCSYPLHTGMLLWGPSLSLLFSREKRFNSFCLLSKGLAYNTLVIFIAFLWTLSDLAASFLNCGDENWVWYCRCGLRNAEQSGMITHPYLC